MGMITDRDLCCSVVAQGMAPKTTPIVKLITLAPLTCSRWRKYRDLRTPDAAAFPSPDRSFRYEAVDGKGDALRPVPYKEEKDLSASWESFDLKHELTDKGIKRFVDDYKSTLKSAA